MGDTMNITELPNEKAANALQPIKEVMDQFIPGIPEEMNIPRRNGAIVAFVGAPGSGKSSLLYSMLNHKYFWRKKFHHCDLFCPEASYLSVQNHPLRDLPPACIHHELTPEALMEIYEDKSNLKRINVEKKSAPQYSLIVIDDFGTDLRDSSVANALKRIMIKSRHINTCVAMTLQSYVLLDPTLRKMLTDVICFRPNTEKEWTSLCDEHMPRLSKDQRTALHRHCFSQPYSHLDVNCRPTDERKQFCRNFNQLILDD